MMASNIQSDTKVSSDARSAIRNSAASVAAQMANLLVGLVSSVYIARVLGKEQFGMFGWALGLSTVLMPLANAGLDNVIVRDVARQRDKAPEYLLSAFLVKICSSSICYLGIVWYLQFRGYSGLQLAVGYILCAIVIAESFNATCRAVLVAMERQDLIAIVSVLTNGVRVGAVVLLIYLGFNIVAVACVTVSIALVTFAANLVAIKRLASGLWRVRLVLSRHLVLLGTTFLASQIFAALFDRADYIMLDIFKDIGSVGIYGAAYRIIEIVTMIGYSCSLALFPIISRKVLSSKEEYAHAVQRSTKYLTVFGIPLCVGIFLLSHQLMVGLYSLQFAASGTCLSILIWSRIGVFAVLPGQQAVASRNAQLWLVPPVIARAALGIGLNLYLIPRYGYIGASASMVIAENVYYVLNYVVAFRGPERFNPVTLFARPLLATGAMTVIILLVRPFGIVLATAAGILAYALALPLFGVIDSQDKQLLKALVSGLTRRGGDSG